MKPESNPFLVFTYLVNKASSDSGFLIFIYVILYSPLSETMLWAGLLFSPLSKKIVTDLISPCRLHQMAPMI